ncbi:tyrosine-protein phosphatase [Gordonia sp. CPCC 205333]|uniref:tyrosine-protein phosphatase n=1 Tax=Gordonia sp. CPCC 205333 TaxID=3140790 RepID=UPI003AF390AB
MSTSADQPSLLSTLANFRDLGGWSTPDGEVIRGILFRSNHLSDLSDADRGYVDGLSLTTIYDFRTTDEINAAPDPSLNGADNIQLDVLADAELSVPANLMGLFADPDTAAQVSEQLASNDVGKSIGETYRGLVTYGSARAGYRDFFAGLAARPGPALFHCTAGKDRTGWGAAALLSLLGVAREDVYADYLLTNDLLVPSFAEVFKLFGQAGGDPELLLPVLGVRTAYLDNAFDEVDREFGSISSYFTDGLGLDVAVQRQLREKYLSAR